MERWRRRSRRLTWVLLFASATLIVPGLLGITATIPFSVVLGAGTGALWVFRDRLATLPTIAGYDLGWYASDCWAGGAVGATISLVMLNASPAELQALGGVAGLIGMVNYFLRPLVLYLGYNLRQLLG